MKKLCWCGNSNLQEFSSGYWRCNVCSTLVSKSLPSTDITDIVDEENDFYGKKYWLNHQVEELGLAAIDERSRSDLLDRCGWWLEGLLEFKLPPARLLEVGCSHGGFLALAQLAGFRGTGVELSPWVVDFARKAFGVDVRVGPIEQQNFQAGSFDVICMFDVLEHLQEPTRTLKRCAEVLDQNGIVLIQTPRYPTGIDFGELEERQDPFLKMMLPNEHLFLFSKQSVTKLLQEVGLSVHEFLPARFAEHDTMLAAAKESLPRNPAPTQLKALENSATGRFIQGYLSLFQQNADLESQRDGFHRELVRTHKDADDRLRLIERLSGEVERLSGEVERLSGEVERLSGELRRTCAERDELRERTTFRGMMRYRLKRLFSRNQKPFAA